jgi:cell shape-determining protein MreD
MIFSLLLGVILCFGMIIQDFIPSIPWAYSSHFHLVAVLFFACAVSVPFPVMLIFAFFTGFVWDAKNMVQLMDRDVAQAAANLGVLLPKSGGTFGFSIFLYGLFGSLMQGIRPLFRRGRWEMALLMVGVGTFLLLLFEYLWINFRRGGFYFPASIWYYISTTALLSMAVAPLAFYLIHRLARTCGYHIRLEAMAYRRWQS